MEKQENIEKEAGALSHLSDELGVQNKPTFAEWLKQQKIVMTTREAVDYAMLATQKGVSVQKLLGYPYA